MPHNGPPDTDYSIPYCPRAQLKAFNRSLSGPIKYLLVNYRLRLLAMPSISSEVVTALEFIS